MKKKRKAKRSGAIKEESADERGHKEKKMRNKKETAAIKEMKSWERERERGWGGGVGWGVTSLRKKKVEENLI